MGRMVSELINYNEHEKIYMPNEIFSDLMDNVKRSNTKATVYSYYYLVSWLYRYAKYGQETWDVSRIKETLGFSKTSTEINAVIKKGGLVDQLGYTVSSTDYPLAWEYKDSELDFMMLSDSDVDVKKMILDRTGRNFKVKVPVKGLWRTTESEEEGILDGTFYEIANTHHVPIGVFDMCMRNKRLGCTGFYLYGFMMYRCQWYSTFSCSIENIGKQCGMSKGTTEKYLHELKECKLIKVKENDCVSVDGKVRKEANTYMIA